MASLSSAGCGGDGGFSVVARDEKLLNQQTDVVVVFVA
jgi:hypothetical protein